MTKQDRPPIHLGDQRFDRHDRGTYLDVARPDQSLANWALGLSFVPCFGAFMVGAGLGLATLVRSRKDGLDHGRTKAWWSLVVSTLWVAGIGAVVALSWLDRPGRDDDGEITETGDVAITDLRTGDCLVSVLVTGDQESVTVTPCEQPHRGEVYAEFDLSRFPGAGEVTRLADDGCSRRLPATVDVGSEPDDLQVTLFYPPDRDAYEADPTVTCVVESARPRTGSAVPVS